VARLNAGAQAGYGRALIPGFPEISDNFEINTLLLDWLYVPGYTHPVMP
jgi:hypothetical protein